MKHVVCALVANDGTFTGEAFSMPVDADTTIGDVLQMAFQSCPSIPRGLNSRLVTVWKPDEFFPLNPYDSITGHVKNLHLDDSDPRAQELGQANPLTYYIELNSLLPIHVHLVIQLAKETLATVTRRRYEWAVVSEKNEAMVEFLRTSAYTNEAPSSLAHLSQCPNNQEDGGRPLNDRPSKDIDVTPIALLYRPFGQFLDRMLDSPEEEDGIDIEKLESAVDEFAFEMTFHYQSESDRQTHALRHFDKIFSSNTSFDLPQIRAGHVRGNLRSDGHANGPAGLMETIVAVKNELGAGNADPKIRITSYFSHAHREYIAGGLGSRGIYDRFLFPTLGISIIGKNTVQFV